MESRTLFLSDLEKSPVGSSDLLEKKIEKLFIDFEEKNPACQSFFARKLIYSAQKKLTALSSLSRNAEDRDESNREKYFLMCGLIFDIHDQINYNLADKILFDMIHAFLSEIAITQDDGQRKKCLELFIAFKKDNPKMQEISDKDFHELECKQYQSAYTTLQALLIHEKRLASSVLKRVESIAQLIRRFALKKEYREYIKFFTVILRETHTLLSMSERNFERYEGLATLVETTLKKPKKTKKISGGLIATTTLLGVSAVACVGLASYSGQKTLSRGIGIGATAVAGISAGVGASMLLFKQPKQPSLSNEMMQLAYVLKKMKEVRRVSTSS